MPEPTPCDLLIAGRTVLDLDSVDGRIDAAVVVAEGLVVSVDTGELHSAAEAAPGLVRSHS
jgi:hypothetical protein